MNVILRAVESIFHGNARRRPAEVQSASSGRRADDVRVVVLCDHRFGGAVVGRAGLVLHHLDVLRELFTVRAEGEALEQRQSPALGRRRRHGRGPRGGGRDVTALSQMTAAGLRLEQADRAGAGNAAGVGVLRVSVTGGALSPGHKHFLVPKTVLLFRRGKKLSRH